VAAGAVSPLRTTLRPGPRRAEHLVGRDHAVVIQSHRLTGLEQAALRARGDTERIGCLDVEATRPRMLDQREPKRLHPVRDREGDEVVVAALEHVAGSQLGQLELIGQLPEDPAQRAEEVLQPRRPVDRQRHLAAAQREGLQHPGQAEVVIGVKVRDEDLAQLDQADRGAQHLPLRAFAAVEQEPLAAPAHEQRRRRPLRGRHRAGGPEEDQVEVHDPIVGLASP